APEEILGKMVQAKQAADLHTPSFSQRIVYEAVQDGFIDRHIPSIRTLYGAQCEHMLAALEREFPKEARWNGPEGGMFSWVQLPEGRGAVALLAEAIERNVAFVPGPPFCAVEPRRNTLRLSFVTVPAEKIDHGIKVLGELLKAEIAALPAAAGCPRHAPIAVAWLRWWARERAGNCPHRGRAHRHGLALYAAGQP